MLTGSADGYLKIYDVKTGGVKRLLQISNLSLTSIAEMNETNSVVIGSANNKMYLLNTTLGKATSSFEAHEDSIVGIFYSQKLNKVISDGADSVYKVWDVNKKMAIQSYFDTDSQIVTCDYRDEDSMHICIDTDGALAIRSLSPDKLVFKLNLESSSFYCARFDKNDLNKYYISSENGLDIYDIRMNRIIDTATDWNDMKYFINGYTYFFVDSQNDEKLSLREYEKYDSYVKKYDQFGNVSHIFGGIFQKQK